MGLGRGGSGGVEREDCNGRSEGQWEARNNASERDGGGYAGLWVLAQCQTREMKRWQRASAMGYVNSAPSVEMWVAGGL